MRGAAGGAGRWCGRRRCRRRRAGRRRWSACAPLSLGRPRSPAASGRRRGRASELASSRGQRAVRRHSDRLPPARPAAPRATPSTPADDEQPGGHVDRLARARPAPATAARRDGRRSTQPDARPVHLVRRAPRPGRRCAGSTAAPAPRRPRRPRRAPAPRRPAAPRRRRRPASAPSAPAVPQRPGEDDGDDVDGRGARAGRSRRPARAGRRRSAAAGRASRRAGARTIRCVEAAHDVGRSAARPSAKAPKSSAVSRRPAHAERPAADDVGEEVHAEPHAGQPDEQDERDAGGERPVPGARGQQRPGQHQRDGDQRGDARGVPARDSSASPAARRPRRSRAAPARSSP